MSAARCIRGCVGRRIRRCVCHGNALLVKLRITDAIHRHDGTEHQKRDMQAELGLEVPLVLMLLVAR